MYTLLKPEALGYIPIETLSPEFVFSLDWVDEKTIQMYLDNNIIANGNNE